MNSAPAAGAAFCCCLLPTTAAGADARAQSAPAEVPLEPREVELEQDLEHPYVVRGLVGARVAQSRLQLRAGALAAVEKGEGLRGGIPSGLLVSLGSFLRRLCDERADGRGGDARGERAEKESKKRRNYSSSRVE